MAISKRKAGRITGVLLGTVLIVVGVGSAAFWMTRNLAPVQPQMTRPSPVAPDSNVVNVRPSRHHKVTVYVVKTTEGESSLQPEKVEVSVGIDRHKAALNELLARVGSSGSTIPKGTTLQSVQVRNGLAVIDLSKQFVDNFNGGSEEESLAINAITRTVAQFGDVDKVRILVEGQKIGTLGGHFELEEPIDVASQSQKSGETSE